MSVEGSERVLRIEGLSARAADTQILNAIDLQVYPGEVHAIMGPNGSGKSTLSHVLLGRPGYEVTAGSVSLDGIDLLGLDPWQRAQAGLFLCLQHPTEVPGVTLEALLSEISRFKDQDSDQIKELLRMEANRLGIEERFLDRALNVDLSGGEKKRNEMLQLGVLGARYAVLDEIDSGLDVDALTTVAQRIQDATEEEGLGVIAITHFRRLLEVLEPDRVHILFRGSICMTGGPELAERLEAEGYGGVLGDSAIEQPEVSVGAPRGPGFGEDPFIGGSD